MSLGFLFYFSFQVVLVFRDVNQTIYGHLRISHHNRPRANQQRIQETACFGTSLRNLFLMAYMRVYFDVTGLGDSSVLIKTSVSLYWVGKEKTLVFPFSQLDKHDKLV